MAASAMACSCGQEKDQKNQWGGCTAAAMPMGSPGQLHAVASNATECAHLRALPFPGCQVNAFLGL